jgi:hypothetical protein
VWTTSRITVPVETSSFSMPGMPSARVGPRLTIRTGLVNSSACLSNRKAEYVARVVPAMSSRSQAAISAKLRSDPASASDTEQTGSAAYERSLTACGMLSPKKTTSGLCCAQVETVTRLRALHLDEPRCWHGPP